MEEETKEERIIEEKDEKYRKLKKSNNRKKALIVILIFTLILAGLFIFVLLTQKKNEEIKPEETKQEEKKEETKEEPVEEQEQPSTAKVTFNGKEYTIRTDLDLNDNPVTYLNDKRIDGIAATRAKAMDGYLVLINDGGQFGSQFLFLDDSLSILPIDVNYQYTASNSGDYGPIFDFSNNKVKANFLNTEHLPGTSSDFSISNLYVYANESKKDCTLDGKKNPSVYKETIEKYRNDIVKGTIEFSYSNHKITYNYIDKKTVWDLLGNDITNNTNSYCIELATD